MAMSVKGRAGGASKILPLTSEEGDLLSIRGIAPALDYVQE